MKNLPAVVRRGGVPALLAGWTALGWWPLPQLVPQLVRQPLNLRTAIVTSLVWIAGLWFALTVKGER